MIDCFFTFFHVEDAFNILFIFLQKQKMLLMSPDAWMVHIFSKIFVLNILNADGMKVEVKQAQKATSSKSGPEATEAP